MALLNILTYPDPELRKPAEDVPEVDDEIRALLDDMAETMYAAPGVGLAAVQVGRHIRVLVMDIPEPDEEGNAPGEAITTDGERLTGLVALVNARVVGASGETITWEEGCLSVPGVYEEVKRPGQVRVEALDRNGKPLVFDAAGLPAVAVQHEIDHLDGVLFIDRLPPVKRRLVKKRIDKAIEEGKYPPRPATETPEA